VLGELKLDPAIARAHLATDRVRATASVAILVASGRRLYLRSHLDDQRLANGDVLLLDSIGELAPTFKMCARVR